MTDAAARWRAVRDAVRRAGRATFGDRTGLALFLGALAFYGLYWRVDVFIVDTFAVANTLVALADGHLHLARLPFGPSDGAVPGMHVVDGRLYGRNYGHAALALPFLWGLRALSAVADLRVALAGLWSLAFVGFAVQVGRLTARERLLTVAGCAVGLAAFVANVLLATDLPARVRPLLALQLSTLVATALVAVVTYRLVGATAGRRVGAVAGAAAAVLGPVGFWAVIPKRHTVTALFALLALYSFHRSRADGDLRFRALAYACVGPTAWVSAPEGLVLAAALVPADLLTARRRDARALAAVGGAFLLGLAPFFLTNLAIAGNPLEPPRMLPSYESARAAADAAGGQPVGGGSGGDAGAVPSGGAATGGGDGGTGAIDAFVAALATALGAFAGELEKGVAALDPARLYHVFVRGGRIPGVDYSQTGGQTVELTLLESAPLLGALLALPALALGRVGTDAGALRRATRAAVAADRPLAALSPARQTDLFAASFAALFALLYLPRLPLHATITVRYLVPAVPFLLYGAFRLSAVRRAVDEEHRLLAALSVALVPVGCVLAAVGLAGTDAGTAMQAHALANLAVAALLGVWAAASARWEFSPRVGAALLAVALAAMATFLLMSGLEYFGAGRQFALPAAEAAQRLLPVR